MAVLLWILFLTNLAQGSDNEFRRDLSTEKANVGDNITLNCNFYTNTSVIWYINNTYYNWEYVPDDYYPSSEEGHYIFVIPQVKLWMNNTVFTCFDIVDRLELPLAILHVNFGFSGPNSTIKAKLNRDVYILCNSDLNNKVGVYMSWKINGSIHSPSVMPKFFHQQPNGLIIHPTREYMNGTTIQCLIWSDLLVRNGYYYSDVGTLVLSKTGPVVNLCDTLLCLLDGPQKFSFNYQRFHFSPKKDAYTIAWNNLTNGCQDTWNYYIVGTLELRLYYTINVGLATEYTLNSSQLQYSTSQFYRIHVEAKRNLTSKPCAVTSLFLTTSSQVSTNSMIYSTGGNFCPPLDGQNVVWPFLPEFASHINMECPCDDITAINSCSCVNDTGFIVHQQSDGLICWNNLTTEMNGTQITFYRGLNTIVYDEVFYPGEEILRSYEIIVAEPPDQSIVYAANNTHICIINYSNGYLPLLWYNITIMNNIQGQYSYIYDIIKSQQDICTTVPAKARNLLDPHCRPLSINVIAANDAGISKIIDNTTFHSMEEMDHCNCLTNTVKLNIQKISSSDDNIAKFQILCETSYLNSKRFKFSIHLSNSSQSKPYVCSNEFVTLSFPIHGQKERFNVIATFSHSSINCNITKGPYHPIVSNVNTKIIYITTIVTLAILLSFCTAAFFGVLYLRKKISSYDTHQRIFQQQETLNSMSPGTQSPAAQSLSTHPPATPTGNEGSETNIKSD